MSWLLPIAVLALPVTGWSQAVGGGIITGRVSNAATGASLGGAIIQVTGTGGAAVTERDGMYRLQVPPGSHTLTVSYTGLDDQSLSVSVPAGATVRQDVALTSEIYKLEKFVVAGEREGNALAITMQRQMPNIKNVVTGLEIREHARDQPPRPRGIENNGNVLIRRHGSPILIAACAKPQYKDAIRGRQPEMNPLEFLSQRQPRLRRSLHPRTAPPK